MAKKYGMVSHWMVNRPFPYRNSNVSSIIEMCNLQIYLNIISYVHISYLKLRFAFFRYYPCAFAHPSLILTLLSRWRHQMETFSALLAICAGNSTVPGEFLTQRPVTRSFDVFFDLRLNKRLAKHLRGWWFETLSRPLWRQCNVILGLY